MYSAYCKEDWFQAKTVVLIFGKYPEAAKNANQYVYGKKERTLGFAVFAIGSQSQTVIWLLALLKTVSS